MSLISITRANLLGLFSSFFVLVLALAADPRTLKFATFDLDKDWGI